MRANSEWRIANIESLLTERVSLPIPPVCRVGVARHFLCIAVLSLASGCFRPEGVVRLGEPEHISANRTFNDIAAFDVTFPTDDGALIVDRDNVTLDLKGAHLRPADVATKPDQYTGRGIVVRGAKNVTLRNALVLGFKVAIFAENAPGLTIENVDVSNNYRQHLKSTPQREHLDDWIYGHENDRDEWLRYGAGIYLKNCDGAVIKNCRARNGQNGICLVNCNDATIVGNNMSFMSGWGLALWRSSRCKVIGNRFDYCVRGYSHGVYARGQDSTGILVYEQCNDNIFAYNSATHGGDGLFVYAGHETTQRTGEGGCNRNLIYRNDFSHAVANGIEATFSDQNIFMGNKLNHCTHGIWAGYSRRSLIEDNEMSHCQNGVSIEHGRENRIFWNRFTNCEKGVWLWWDDDKDLIASAFGRKQGADSKNECVERNIFKNCATAIRADTTDILTVNGNTFEGCNVPLDVLGASTVRSLTGNIFLAGELRNGSPPSITGDRNFVDAGVRVTGPISWTRAAPDRETAWSAVHNGPEYHQRDDPNPWHWSRARDMQLLVTADGPPDRLGTKPLSPLRGVPEGKEHILVDEWGPYDYRDVRIIAPPAYAMGAAQLRVLGPGTPFTVTSQSGAVDVLPASGKAPAVITIRPSTKMESVAYTVRLDIDGVRQQPISAVILALDWRIAFYKWTADQDPRASDSNWRAIIGAPPIRSERADHLDFVWSSRSPAEGVPPDRFAVVADTKLRVPPVLKPYPTRAAEGQPGRAAPHGVRLKTISDDGIRVYLNGKKVIDNWTWHVPTEDTADVVLKHENDLRIEYFEIDGHAQLQFFIEPIP